MHIIIVEHLENDCVQNTFKILSSVSEGNEYWATVQSKSRDPELPEEDRKYFAELPK